MARDSYLLQIIENLVVVCRSLMDKADITEAEQGEILHDAEMAIGKDIGKT